MIREATAPDLVLRTETVSDSLNALELAEDELTGPPKESLANPLDARPGDLLRAQPQGSQAARRRHIRGGASGAARRRSPRPEICESKDNERLRKEQQTLIELRHELIVSAKELLSFPDGNAGFLMEYAGEWDRKKSAAEDTRTEALSSSFPSACSGDM